MLAKNQINRNKIDNTAKSDNKNLDFMLFIQDGINGHIEFELERILLKGFPYFNKRIDKLMKP